MTEGAVVMRSILNSRSIRSRMISRCKQPEKAAAEAEAERRGGLHLEIEAGVVEAQLGHGLAQIVELAGVDREQPAEHHRLSRLEAFQRRLGARARSSVIVSPTRVSATCLIEAVK